MNPNRRKKIKEIKLWVMGQLAYRNHVRRRNIIKSMNSHHQYPRIKKMIKETMGDTMGRASLLLLLEVSDWKCVIRNQKSKIVSLYKLKYGERYNNQI